MQPPMFLIAGIAGRVNIFYSHVGKRVFPGKVRTFAPGPKCMTVSYSGQYMLTWMLAKLEIVKCPRGIKGLPLHEEVWKLGLYSLGAEGSHRRQIFGE